MKKAIKTLVITFLIAALLISLKNEYSRYLLGGANYGMQAIIDNYGNKDKKGLNLFVGSSMFRQGLDIYELQQSFGDDTYILSYNGNQPFLEYYEIKYLIDNDVIIDSLYLDMYVFSMQSNPWIQDSKIFLDTDTDFKVQVWDKLCIYNETDFSNFWEMFITSNNYELLTWPITYPIINNRFFRGGNITSNVPASKNGLDEAGNDYSTVDFNKVQISYLEQLIDLCRQNNIKITFIETPKYYSVGESDEYLKLMSKYESILDENNISYYLSNSTYQKNDDKTSDIAGVIDFDNTSADYYIDTLHLSSDGRVAFTDAFTKARDNLIDE